MYSAEISRTTPTAYAFLVDQSTSMNEGMHSGVTKAQFVADVLNRTLRDLIIRCTREDGVRDYFDVAVIGYGGDGVHNALTGALAQEFFNPISVVADNTLRVEERARKIDDGAGGLVEQSVKFPVWLDPQANGSTPMQAVIGECARIVAAWSSAHRDSFPVTVLHISDGVTTDGDPEHNASILRSLSTNDGETLLYNVHVTGEDVEPTRFPRMESQLPDAHSKSMFRMSSTFPDHIRAYAQDAHGETLAVDARAMMMNADAERLVMFIDIGSRPAAMR
jgi:hypothetical protein